MRSKLNDSNFKMRMVGQGAWAEQLNMMFDLAKRKAGVTGQYPSVSVDAFRRPRMPGGQMILFG